MEATLKHPDSIAFYEEHKALYEERHGELTCAADGLLRKAAYLEHLANESIRMCEKNGMEETVWISSTRANKKENKSIPGFTRIAVQQGRILAFLKLLPGNRATGDRENDGDGDENGGALDDFEDC